MEWRWNEREEADIHRTRHRLQAAWTLKQPLGPLGLTFRLSERADLNLFYMIFSVRQQAVWSHESVLGTYLRLRF